MTNCVYCDTFCTSFVEHNRHPPGSAIDEPWGSYRQWPLRFVIGQGPGPKFWTFRGERRVSSRALRSACCRHAMTSVCRIQHLSQGWTLQNSRRHERIVKTCFGEPPLIDVINYKMYLNVVSHNVISIHKPTLSGWAGCPVSSAWRAAIGEQFRGIVASAIAALDRATTTLIWNSKG